MKHDNPLRLSASKSKLSGTIDIPGSKSHTIRALIIASLSEGVSIVDKPLCSADTLSCMSAVQDLGTEIISEETETALKWQIKGFGRRMRDPGKVLDMGNSGTSMNLLTAVAALSPWPIHLDGDQSIRKRPMMPLISALTKLGVRIKSNNGKPPLTIQGPLKGGKTEVEGISSQFVSALLMALPMAPFDSIIDVIRLQEKPYVDMTLGWLKKQAIIFNQRDYSSFFIKGGQSYQPFSMRIPADFSSATFPLCAAAITGSEICFSGLDFSDTQGDKKVFSYLGDMGVKIKETPEGIQIKGGDLRGLDIDLNDTPDALPALAVVGCFAKGTTRLFNVPHARIKECDRIRAMAVELSKMGGKIEERPDGLIIKESRLRGTHLNGYDDHRVVMALAIASLASTGETVIDGADSVYITYPSFFKDMISLGAQIKFDH